MSKPRTISDYPNRADDYDQAVSKSHVQNTDIALDEGGSHEVTAEAIRDHVDSTDNPHGVTAGQVGAYTQEETDDLLDGKADQSELDATNQAVGDLDGRVDTAEDNIQGLEGSKSDAMAYEVVKDLSTADYGASQALVILLARYNEGAALQGTIYGLEEPFNVRSNIMIDFNLRNIASGVIRRQMSLEATTTNRHYSVYMRRVEWQGTEYIAIELSGTTSNWYPRFFSFKGRSQGDNYTLELLRLSTVNVIGDYTFSTSIDGVQKTTYANQRQHGHFNASGYNVTAADFITTSRVESDNENALRALDNIAEWKKKDGTIDYKKHYAYTPMIIRDEAGKVIEEKPGLSMEKRVAMLEKMVAELSDQLQNGKTQRK